VATDCGVKFAVPKRISQTGSSVVKIPAMMSVQEGLDEPFE
jgi:hypothetical protein